MKLLEEKIGEICQDSRLGEDFWDLVTKHRKPKKSEDIIDVVAINVHKYPSDRGSIFRAQGL